MNAPITDKIIASDPAATIQPVEFHLAGKTREKLAFDHDLYVAEAGRWRPSLRNVHDLSLASNRDHTASGFRPGDLFALAALDLAFCVVAEKYRIEKQPNVLNDSATYIESVLGVSAFQEFVHGFARTYPPLEVYRKITGMADFIGGYTSGRSNRERLVLQSLLVFVDNRNPAASSLKPLFDDHEIAAYTPYVQAVAAMREYLKSQPEAALGGITLMDLFEAPMRRAPHSLFEQLAFVTQEWGVDLPESVRLNLLLAGDLIREDEKRGASDIRPRKGDTPVIDFRTGPGISQRGFGSDYKFFTSLESEPEHYTPDTEWMPRTVLVAKSVHVWLDQLSKKYARGIRTLDDIPEQELAELARWGFNSLWLIGLWQRSRASRTIKHLRGNIDAVASAYSLFDYVIADDLGGNGALEELRKKARQHGIRLASDIVPNHMGMDSRWMHDHPDRFLQLNHPPYPAYRFTGTNLSPWPDIELRVEDGYWDQSDAAVVFEMRDHRDGRVRYVYHGNDGTSFPWNDTAQLNFLSPETREAVIQLIIEIAKKFSVIRFDAAMTLTKRHYQRLWFPSPGSGGSIPSRAEHGMSQEQFSRLMPTEFWRDVVDRMAIEAPETLLIAEAFWLTEGFFVRTLGMHRVYNSAFMNMMKNEENAKYRQVIKNTIEFDPRILQRYVNFMNNPDEDTAVEQFGKGDKYFGVATLMATLPGLPMFGHGQIEGFTEKYGHEYQRAYYDEQPDPHLISRHESQLFPLLRQRELFSGADEFYLYDFVTPDHQVDENVFAYSNRLGSRRVLVIYRNAYTHGTGSVHLSAPVNRSHTGAGARLVRKTLADALSLRYDHGLFYILRDHVQGLEYIVSATTLFEAGFQIELGSYAVRVFTEFMEVHDDPEGKLSELASRLGSRGVPSIQREYAKLHHAPLLAAFKKYFAAGLSAISSEGFDPLVDTVGIEDFLKHGEEFFEQAAMALGVGDISGFKSRTQALIKNTRRDSIAKITLNLPADSQSRIDRILLILVCTLPVSESISEQTKHHGDIFEDWLLRDTIAESLAEFGERYENAAYEAALGSLLSEEAYLLETLSGPRRFAAVLHALENHSFLSFLSCHHYRGVFWFSQERISAFINGLKLTSLLLGADDDNAEIVSSWRQLEQIEHLAMFSEFKFDKWKTLLAYAGPPRKAIPKLDAALPPTL